MAEPRIIDYFESPDRDHWLSEIRKSDWRAGQYLYALLKEDRLKAAYGADTRLLLLTEGPTLVAFCDYAARDEIEDPSLTPWVGFVYTFPAFRGQRRAGALLDHAYALAKAEGRECLYVSTEETGLYEKYGFAFWKVMRTAGGSDTRVYRRMIENT